MNWKPEFCGICSHGKRGTLLSRLRVLHVLPVAISMVLFSNFLLNHFPFTCDLLYDFFSFDKHFHNFPVFLSSSRRTRARCVRSRGCAVGRGRQAAAGADAKPQTVKFFIQFLCVFFFFLLSLKKKKRKKAWEEVCCRHGRACSSGSLRMAVPGKQRCLLSQVGTEGVLLLPVPSLQLLLQGWRGCGCLCGAGDL